MKTANQLIAAAVIGTLSIAAVPLFAQQQRPPSPDFASTAATLKVPEATLVSCLGERPQAGQRPQRPDPAKVAACLNNAGYKVSEQAVGEALAAAAPPRG